MQAWRPRHAAVCSAAPSLGRAEMGFLMSQNCPIREFLLSPVGGRSLRPTSQVSRSRPATSPARPVGRPANHSYWDRRPSNRSITTSSLFITSRPSLCHRSRCLCRRLNTEISGRGGRGDRSHLTVHLETVSKYLMAVLLLDFASKSFSTS